MYELHGHRCARITKSLRWLTSQTRALPVYDGSGDTKEFSSPFSEQILDSQKQEILDPASRATATRWWKSHKKYIPSWPACQKYLHLRIMDQPQGVRSRNNPQEHVARCYDAWKRVPQEGWLHRVVHTLDPIAKNWYAAAELRRDTVSWVCTVDSFVLTFSTNMVCPALDVAIRLTHTKVFDDQEVVESRPDWQA